MTTISDDDGDHINIAIPDYDKAAFDHRQQQHPSVHETGCPVRVP
jgi:hypothetical protein